MLQDDFVREALACQLGRRPDTIDPSDELERDLGLQPCDLVLLAQRLEARVGAEFPLAALQSVKTVGGLMRLAKLWSDRVQRAVATSRTG
jgi:acyl carrier protein